MINVNGYKRKFHDCFYPPGQMPFSDFFQVQLLALILSVNFLYYSPFYPEIQRVGTDMTTHKTNNFFCLNIKSFGQDFILLYLI